MINYLDKLKEKCKIDNNFTDIIKDLFEKLIYFGYITQSQEKKLIKKLYNNIDIIIIGDNNTPDYKSGYYDALKKELYIKDISNIKAIYLRILYVLTTKESSKEMYDVGYSTSTFSKNSYKIEHFDFGINRAVVSNLVCRLLYTTPTTLSIVPTYRTYENDFLGNKLNSDNDIYFIEGKILKQICFVFNFNEENLYINLFSKSPRKYLNRFFNRLELSLQKNILQLFDDISRMYSNYNKLCYLNNLLDNNYLNIKKNILTKDITSFETEQIKIKSAIKTALIKLSSENIKDDDNINIESSLSEKINYLEENIILNISNLQEFLINYLISNEDNLSPITYALKLKELEKMIVTKNKNLKDALYNTISKKLLNTFEHTASNLIEKIKYSIINEVLSSEKYIKIYKNLSFKKIIIKEKDDNFELIAINVDNSFVQLIVIDNLNENIKDLEDNTQPIKIDNLKYLLDNPASSSDVHKVEQIFTVIKNKYNKFNDLRIEDFYMFSANKKQFVLALSKNDFNILNVTYDNNIDSKILKLSENYSIFNFHDFSNMPVIYKKNETTSKKIMSLITILFS